MVGWRSRRFRAGIWTSCRVEFQMSSGTFGPGLLINLMEIRHISLCGSYDIRIRSISAEGKFFFGCLSRYRSAITRTLPRDDDIAGEDLLAVSAPVPNGFLLVRVERNFGRVQVARTVPEVVTAAEILHQIYPRQGRDVRRDGLCWTRTTENNLPA
jgi:hypothetical protein